MSIRIKLIMFISLLIVIIDAVGCLFFLKYSVRQHESVLKKYGTSLVTLLAKDSEVKLALSHKQYAILNTSINRIRMFDKDGEIGYWRISDIQTTVIEEKVPWINFRMEEIPAIHDLQYSDEPLINRINTSSADVFYDFSAAVFEKHIFSEETLAAQFFDNPSEWKRQILGFVQIGLSTHKLNTKVRETIIYSIIPVGIGIILGGICITFFLTRYIVLPLQKLTNVTQEIARGNFNRTVDVGTRDEIGKLSINFNQMIRALNKTYNDLRQEVTNHKITEEELRESENKHRMLIENLPQRIFYKNKNLIYVSCNENYARDLNIKSDEIEGMTDYDFYPKELADKYRADDKRIMDLGQVEDIDEKYVRDGREFVIHTVKTPMRDEQGNIIGILGIFWDITEKIALQLDAIRSRQLALLGEMAAGVAHEVNNPINGIINCAQILFNKSSKGSEESDIANRIIKEGGRIADIVNSLLSFARYGDIKVKKINASIHEILSETLILIQAQLKKEGIKIRQNIPHKLPGIIANRQQIQQVFLNILNNARYALNQRYPGTHDNKILEITCEETTVNNCPYIKVTFYDLGTGIPANVLDKILEPFFTIKPIGEGTGLGLNISRSIISDHGGRLMIDSVEGEFTRVVISLPSAGKSH